MATRPYQGYPYTQPYVTDAPSIDAATAARWNNLPRRAIQPPTNVVYVDLPEEGGSQVTVRNEPQPSPGNEKHGLADPDAPVIYIDVPEDSSSDVAGPASPEPEPEYVQETIFYDQFENRRIDQQKEAETPNSDSGASSSRPGRPAPSPPGRHTPPSSLNLNQGSSGSSGYGSSFSSPAGLPASLNREASLYGPDFPTPIPVSEFPEPPPAYSEIAETPYTPTAQPLTEPDRQTPTEPPRTVVITQGADLNTQVPEEQPSPIGLPDPTRKVVYCHHCGLRVHTLVFWEAGPITHVIAFLIFLFLFPLLFLVYCTNYFKYKNHYCPNCNKQIGFELPALCINMTYTK